MILTEHSEVNSESQRKPAVSIARAAATLNTPVLLSSPAEYWTTYAG